MKEYNFSNFTNGQEFPDIEGFNEGTPTVGDPGFVVIQMNGSAKWVPNMQAARDAAGTSGGIFQSWRVSSYYRQFARREELETDGTEKDLGPLL